MTGLDLSGVEQFVNDALIVDEVVIARTNGVGDDVLGPDLVLTPTAPVAIYVGEGAIQPLTAYTAMQDPDVARILEQTDAKYRLLLPLGTEANVQVGDEVWATALHSPTPDPELLRRIFEVADLGGPSSFAVMRTVYLRELRRLDPDEDLPTPAWPASTGDIRIVDILDEGEVPDGDPPEGTVYLIRPAP